VERSGNSPADRHARGGEELSPLVLADDLVPKSVVQLGHTVFVRARKPRQRSQRPESAIAQHVPHHHARHPFRASSTLESRPRIGATSHLIPGL
jgi:hypothetical protein